MSSQRLSLVILAAVMLLAVLAGLWISNHLTGMFGTSTATPIPSPTVTPVPPSPSPVSLSAPKGFRLAGVAVNVDQMYAVIEFPDGHHALFRLHDEVDGLGRLAHIGAERVVVTTKDGDLTLWVAPAATSTPTATRRQVTVTPKRTPSPARVGAGTTPGSTLSVAPGRPAF
ncbi:MAG TPA: hypothetical protein VMT89_19230 [Candidatus Acidoferrales bacterium]|nr:hypothetical protein [Candidatus Acidoferrales bacterium]